jgi:cytidylate kinase
MTEDVGKIGKMIPQKSPKMTDKAQIGDGNLQFDVKGVSYLNTTNNSHFANYLAQAEKMHNETTVEIQQHKVVGEAAMREQAIQEAKETFAEMMEVRALLVSKYRNIIEMQTPTS